MIAAIDVFWLLLSPNHTAPGATSPSGATPRAAHTAGTARRFTRALEGRRGYLKADD
jgi:hypothetical protein